MQRNASQHFPSCSNFFSKVGSDSPSVDDITASFLAAYPDRVIPALLENPETREQVRTALAGPNPDKKPSKGPQGHVRLAFQGGGPKIHQICHWPDPALTQLLDGFEGKGSPVLPLQDLLVDIQKNVDLNSACAPLEHWKGCLSRLLALTEFKTGTASTTFHGWRLLRGQLQW